MSACVSPPQESVSHIVQVAAIIAHAASTALPPFWKIIAPAVAASGLPVIASHFRAWRGGLLVAACNTATAAATAATPRIRRQIRAPRGFVIAPPRRFVELMAPRNSPAGIVRDDEISPFSGFLGQDFMRAPAPDEPGDHGTGRCPMRKLILRLARSTESL